MEGEEEAMEGEEEATEVPFAKLSVRLPAVWCGKQSVGELV